MKHAFFACLAATGMLTSMVHAQGTNVLPSAQLDWTIKKSGQLNYVYHVPKDYKESDSKRWPLMVFLHGIGERGTDVQKVTVHGPLKYVKEGHDLPFIIISPQCPDRQYWNADVLVELINHATNRFKVDDKRIYATGLSMGGFGTWQLALAYPERFAAVLPICGGGDSGAVIIAGLENGKKKKDLLNLPMWVFHGAKDTVVPPDESERLVKRLRGMGAKEVKYTIYPDRSHDSWSETYSNPEIYDWLLKHKLGDAK